MTTSTDLTPCDFPVFTSNEFPSLAIKTSDDPTVTPPASVCVAVEGIGVRATVGAGEGATVELHLDTE